MIDSERMAFELQGRRPALQLKVAQAREIVATFLERAANPYVAFSGGKDSTVVLHLLREQAPSTPAVFSDDEWNLPETTAFVAATPNCHKIAARIYHADWFTSWRDGPARLPSGTHWIDTDRNDGLQAYARQMGYDGAALGLRADENSRRRTHLRANGTCFFAAVNGVWQCNPVAWWNDLDIWSYIVGNQLPYNAAYDRLAALGVPLSKRRIGPLAVERVLGYGQLAILKRGWPELFNRFAAVFPEARSYV